MQLRKPRRFCNITTYAHFAFSPPLLLVQGAQQDKEDDEMADLSDEEILKRMPAEKLIPMWEKPGEAPPNVRRIDVTVASCVLLSEFSCSHTSDSCSLSSGVLASNF